MSPAAAEAAKGEPEGHSSRGRRVLVAEDSPITHDLLKLLLNQRGHQVDIAVDGRQALEALRRNDYDVALLDFHLPQMDGLQVASAIKKEAQGRKLPRLIAITADVEGLLSHEENCENFDNIIPKPLDVYQVGKLVEEQADIADKLAEGAGPQAKAGAAPLSRVERDEKQRLPSFLEGLGFQFLVWPGDLDAVRLSARAMQATLGDPRFDAVVVTEPVPVGELASLWRRKALYVLPIIDLTGALGVHADLDASKLTARNTEAIGKLIGSFQDQRARLSRDLLFSEATGEELVGRVYVAERPLYASLDPLSRSLVSYNVALDSAEVAREAEGLCAQGLMRRKFFDRFYICPRCDSSRMQVREECSKCRSADLTEESYLHHFKCAYQGPEAEFRQGDDLICPKCRRELSHFGFDYDRPGTMIVCRSCGHAGSEPSIGFLCVDCGGHIDSEACETRDVHSYELTDKGVGFAEHGRTFLGEATNVLRFAELPIELVVALNVAAKSYNENKAPFTLINIYYANEREIASEHGARQFAQARDLFIENVRSALSADKTDMVVKGQSYDYVLLHNIDPHAAQPEFDDVLRDAQKTVRYDLGARFKAFGPEDFS